MQEEAEVEWKAQREMTDERLKELEVLGECELKFGPFAEDDTSPNPFKSIKKALGSTIERVSKNLISTKVQHWRLLKSLIGFFFFKYRKYR